MLCIRSHHANQHFTPTAFLKFLPQFLLSVLLKSFYKNKSYQSFSFIISKTLLAKLNIFNTMATQSGLWLMYSVRTRVQALHTAAVDKRAAKEERANKLGTVNNHSRHVFWSFLKGDKLARLVLTDQFPLALLGHNMQEQTAWL